MSRNPSIVIAHHWLVSQRGGENVLVEIVNEYPDAEIITLVVTRNLKNLHPVFRNKKIKSSLLSLVPYAEKIYKHFLPIYPILIGLLKVNKKSRLLLSSDASMIKGIRKSRNTKHICYCHSPPRYIWDLSDEYMSSFNFFIRFVFRLIIPLLRKFDLKSAKNVDYFIANSAFVQERIRRIYNRDSMLIYPPVTLADFQLSQKSENFYLIVSALVPYKRIDIAVDAFSKLGRKLIIIGNGSEINVLKEKATSNIIFLRNQPKEVLIDHYQRCKAFIFPGIEDFGITPLEAQACGKPVVAFRGGGALETVWDGRTGVFFDSQTSQSLIEAIQHLDSLKINPHECRENAKRFSPENFREQLKVFIESKIN